MVSFLIQLLVSGLAVLLASYLLPGVHVATFGTAIGVAVTLGLLNLFVKPLLVLLTLPVTVLTLGLFLLVINVFIVYLADALFVGFEVEGFWWALAFSLVLSVINSAFQSFLGE